MAQYQILTLMHLAQAAITASAVTVYTSPAAALTTIQDITVVNTNSTTATFNVFLVPPTGTAGAAYAMFYNCSLLGGQTVQWTGNQVLSAGWTIKVQASTTGLTINIGGQQAV